MGEYLRLSETAQTRAEARFHVSTRFSDEDLLLRISQAEAEITLRVDASYVIGQVATLAFLSSPVAVPTAAVRVLPNRILKSGVRCLTMDEAAYNALKNSPRTATITKPIATISAGTVRVFPLPSVGNIYYVTAPDALSTISHQAGTETTTLTELFEEAIVQHVLESCYMSFSKASPSDAGGFSAKAQYARLLFEQEMLPFLGSNKPASQFRDANTAAEKTTA